MTDQQLQSLRNLGCEFEEAADLICSQAAEIEALRADAERLDWLDKQRESIWTHWTNHAIGLPPTFHGFSVNTDETPHANVRAAIDAARQQGEKR